MSGLKFVLNFVLNFVLGFEQVIVKALVFRVAIPRTALQRLQKTNPTGILHQNQSPKFMIFSAEQDPNGQKLQAFATTANGLVTSELNSKIRRPLHVNSPISGSAK